MRNYPGGHRLHPSAGVLLEAYVELGELVADDRHLIHRLLELFPLVASRSLLGVCWGYLRILFTAPDSSDDAAAARLSGSQ